MLNKHMSSSGSSGPASRILFISSSSAYGPSPDQPVLTASHAFLNSFARSLRREYLYRRVLISLACPSSYDLLAASSSTSRSKNLISTSSPAGLRLQLPWARASNSQRMDGSGLWLANAMVHGMEAGRDLIAPGFLNKIYLHLVCNIFPTPLVANIAKMMSSGARLKNSNANIAIVSNGPILQDLADDVDISSKLAPQEIVVRIPEASGKASNKSSTAAAASAIFAKLRMHWMNFWMKPMIKSSKLGQPFPNLNAHPAPDLLPTTPTPSKQQTANDDDDDDDEIVRKDDILESDILDYD
jgi:hypothetical protein